MQDVFSVTKVQKRQYGASWLWAVWCNVTEPITGRSDWNSTDPTDSGFCETKSRAKWAAWDALKKHAPERSGRHTFFTRWAWDYLLALERNDKRPIYSRCSIGKNRWQWVVMQDLCDEPIAVGIAESPEAARQEAEQRCGSLRDTGNWAAEAYRKKQLAIHRSQKTSTQAGAASVEFVYRCYHYESDYDGADHDCVEKHRIVKRTKKRIFVEDDEYSEATQPSGNWRDYIQKTFVLDRHEYETTGKAKRRSRGWWDTQTYYSSPDIYFADCARSSRPECFVVLDLPADATGDQIATAYRRLATTTHPDVGGNAEEFKKVHRAFEEAMAIVANGVTAA